MMITIVTSIKNFIFLFFQFCNILQDHPHENLAMFWLLNIYGSTNLLKYFYI
jgi:hypothetical protein